MLAGGTQQRLELKVIGLGPAIDDRGQAQVRAGLDAGRKLGVTAVFPA
jgi:hypothetical protein